MSLRVRLLAAMTALVVLVVVAGVLVVRTQRSFLVQQVDDQLTATQRFAGPPARPIGAPVPTGGLDDGAPLDPDAPISSLFVGIVEAGQVATILQGQLIDDVPAVPADVGDLAAMVGDPTTVPASDGSGRFRVQVEAIEGSDAFLVTALPLDEVDSAVQRLELVLVIVGALVIAAVGSTIWWVEQLGIGPIRRVTAVADAIAAGDRSQRVQGTDPATEAGKLAHAFNLMLDDRDAIEQRRRQFVADASHELRTPLTSFQGYLDLYEQGRFRDTSQVDDMVRRMGRETARMKDLVEDLLLLANLDQQRPLRADVVDVAALVDDAGADARAVQPERTITVDTPDRPVETTGDLFRLQQVLGVLVDNALTHTESGVALHLRARAVEGGGAEIEVRDDGPGLDAEEAIRVFDRFYRGDRSRSRRAGNSGLGLSIAQSIVEAHGGTIELATAPGAGCCFTIRLGDRSSPPGTGSPDGRVSESGPC